MSSPATLLKSLRTRLDGRRRDLRADVRPGSGALAYADGRRAAVGLVLAAGLLGAFLLLAGSAVTAERAQGDECPNAEFRTGRSAQLPDCRAYEQVTPVYKGEQDAPLVSKDGQIYDPGVANNGSRAAYFSQGAFSGSQSPNTTYVATRDQATNWSSVGLLPTQSVITGVACIQGAVGYAEDMSRVVIVDGGGQGFFGCGDDDPPLVPGRPEGVANLFTWDADSGQYQLVSINPISGNPAEPKLVGGTPDLSHIVFEESALLTSDAGSGRMLYAWSDGDVRLVSQVPTVPATSCTGAACVPVANARLGSPPNQGTVDRIARAVSEDGSRIAFRAKPSGGVDSLYLREGNTTTQIDAAQGGSGPDGGGTFMTASVDGSSIFFTSESELTADSTASAGHPDLYRYDVETGDLVDLTVDATDPAGADVQGVVGASDDGSYLYFVANGVLASNTNSNGDSASQGNCGGTDPTFACNLYLWHGGTTTFIATLQNSDRTDWGVNTPAGLVGAAFSSRVTPDGQRVVFNSTRSLTGYDNAPMPGSVCVNSSNEQAPCNQVYIYDATSQELQCASCNPGGERPIGASRIPGSKTTAVFFAGPRTGNFSLPRALSDDGSRVFFNSDDSLVPADTNHRQDAYVWENGQISLLSSGRHEDDSKFFDASADGDSAFFITRERLLPQDSDDLLDLYDARVGGGLASQNQPPPQPPCTGDSCKGDQSAPPVEEPNGSGEFTGPGNKATGAARCLRKGERAQRLARKVKRVKRQVRRAHGKRVRRQARRKLRQSKHRYRRAQRRSVRCERGAR